MDFGRFGKQNDDGPGDGEPPANPLIAALEKAHEDALKGELSSAEYGRRVTEALSGASRQDIAEAAQYLSESIGQASPDDARLSAIERLTEMHAAGKISKEDFERERKRISEY